MSNLRDRIKHRWQTESGYRHVLVLAIPLILSTGAWSVQHFVDRMFLTWHSPEAVAAAMPAGMLNFMIMSIFLGTATYTSTFVAQYHGAGRPDRVGPSIWQGVYIAIIGGVVLIGFIPLAEPIFRLVDHDPVVQRYEVLYFRVLCLGGIPMVASASMSGFFAGLGRTWPVMWVNSLTTAVNLALDYLLIFGNFGFPRLGIEGAAIATVLASLFSLGLYLVLFYRQPDHQRYHLFRGWRFDRALFKRLLYYGMPSGVQFFLEIAGFTIFILFVGRLGTIELAATNIAFNINTIAFMPMIGIGIAVSVLVGQNLGKNRPDLAEKSVYSGFHLTFVYMASVAALYVLTPHLFLAPFAAQANGPEFERIYEITIILLIFVAIYSLFDTLAIIFASALRGAGDTRFVMFMLVIISLLVLVIPSYIAMVVLGMNIYVAWTIASVYVSAMGVAFYVRFRGGKWKKMRVIEEAPTSLPTHMPEVPSIIEPD